MIVFLASETIGLAALAGSHAGIEGTRVIEVVRTVVVGVLIAYEMVGDSLEEIASHLGIEFRNQAVRQIGICLGKHLVGVLESREQGIQGRSGCLRSLAQAGISQLKAFAGNHARTQKGY